MAQRRPSRLTSCDACAHPSVHRAMERWIMTRSELLRHLASAADWGATLLSDPLLIMDIPVLGLRQPPINIDNPCGDTIPSTPVGASGSRGTCRSPGMIVQKLVDPSRSKDCGVVSVTPVVLPSKTRGFPPEDLAEARVIAERAVGYQNAMRSPAELARGVGRMQHSAESRPNKK